jgi:predicted N-acyltransferase
MRLKRVKRVKRRQSAPPGNVAAIVDGFECRIVSTIDAVHPTSWDDLCASADAQPFLTRRFLGALEGAPPIAGVTRYLLLTDLRDQRDRSSTTEGAASSSAATYSAAAVVTVLTFDLSLLAPPRARTVISALRRILPRLLHVRVAACALSVSVGQSSLLIRPGVDVRRALRAVDMLLRYLATRARATVLAYADLRPQDSARFAVLATRGYGRLPNLPMHSMPVRFRDFDDYVSQLRTGYRKSLRRTKRRLVSAGVTLERVEDPAEILRRYDDAAHRLYLAVVARAEYQYEVLSRETFHALARAFPGEVTLLLARAPSGEVIGYAWSLVAAGRYYALYLGLDYAWNARCDLYFNLVDAEVAYALNRGARRIELGQTADRFKQRLGCEAEARTHCLRASGALTSLLLRAILPLLAPQPTPALALRVFRNSSTLAAAQRIAPMAQSPSPHE